MRITALAIDLAKNVFQLHGVNEQGRVVLQKSVKRGQLRGLVASLGPCTVGMETCGGAHHWGREFEKLGHTVKLIPAQFVKPFVKSQKNDRNDAEAIYEAMMRPAMRFVPVKTVRQQQIQALHRVRKRLVGARTALINEMRALLHEEGVIAPQGPNRFRKVLPDLLKTAEISPYLVQVVVRLSGELRGIEEQIEFYDEELDRVFKENEACQRIAEIEGVGKLTATAIVAAVGEPKNFKNGRQFAAWLGLTPRQHSSGGKSRLLGISKRGDSYLRCLLIHGARSALIYAPRKSDLKSQWVTRLKERRGMNKASVALANKNARTIWALLATGKEYRTAA